MDPKSLACMEMPEEKLGKNTSFSFVPYTPHDCAFFLYSLQNVNTGGESYERLAVSPTEKGKMATAS